MHLSDAQRPSYSGSRTPEHDDDLPTQASIFREMKDPCPKKRQIAWGAFYRRYARIIAGFARNMGARPDEIDNIIQEVMLGFFKALDKFEYDPSKGRFRGFLKVCTFRVLQEHLRARARFQGMPLEDVDPGSAAVDAVWNDVWELEHLHRALEMTRAQYAVNPRSLRTYLAFVQNVLLEKPAETVAKELGMNVQSVYTAKLRVTDAVAGHMKKLVSCADRPQ
jgi:RNA polymerase sigma-70 factor (ECF subfamily)